MKRFNTLIALSVILILATACAPAVQTETNPSSGIPAQDGAYPPAGTVFEGTATIELKNFAFSPQVATVKVGTVVTWINTDNASHNVTADDNSFVSPQLGQNGSFTFTFDQPGTYTYTCTTHPSMKGTIIVI
jgi:plastocyanin